MRVFVTGASGYIGGSIAMALVRRGEAVIGLVRGGGDARELGRMGIEPLRGTLDDTDVLREGCRRADAVIHAADADHRPSAETLVEALRGTGRALLQTSGSGVVGDEAGGEPSDAVLDETTPFTPCARMANRAAIDELIRTAAGMRGIVIRPSLIYGKCRALPRESFQLPLLLEHARRTGEPRWIGRGLNIWSHVHLDDVVDLYLRALDRAPAGALYYAESGELAMRDLVTAIARLLGLAGREAGLPVDQAVAVLGPRAPISLASNSRVRAVAARRDLGWAPRWPGLLDELERGYYARHYLRRYPVRP